MPRRLASCGAAAGTGVGIVHDATITRSMSVAATPAAASALLPAASAMSTTVSSGSAQRRSEIPTRLLIQSSSVSTPRAIRSWLVITFDGR